MLTVSLRFAFISVCLLSSASAQTVIHRCLDAEGNVVFSQLPCEAEEAAETDAPDNEDQVDEQPETRMEAPVEGDPPESEFFVVEELREARSEEEVAACKKQYRDAIDAIDAEMAREYSPENAEQYKERLLALTRQLRQC